MREKLYSLLEAGNHASRICRIYDYAMVVLIVASLIPLMFKERGLFFDVIEGVAVAFFIFDYLGRWVTADLKLKRGRKSFLIYPFTPVAIIDLISIIPALDMVNNSYKLLRILRLISIARIFKLMRYSKSAYIVIRVLSRQRSELGHVCLIALSYIIVAALIVFNVEPDTFSNFFMAIYWATMSLTTVGYGDIYPVSDAGRIVAMISSLVGVAVVALPASIITAGYMEELHDFDAERFESLKENETFDWLDDEGQDITTDGEKPDDEKTVVDDATAADATADVAPDATADAEADAVAEAANGEDATKRDR